VGATQPFLSVTQPTLFLSHPKVKLRDRNQERQPLFIQGMSNHQSSSFLRKSWKLGIFSLMTLVEKNEIGNEAEAPCQLLKVHSHLTFHTPFAFQIFLHQVKGNDAL
jgi:hypothetical protein